MIQSRGFQDLKKKNVAEAFLKKTENPYTRKEITKELRNT